MIEVVYYTYWYTQLKPISVYTALLECQHAIHERNMCELESIFNLFTARERSF